MSVCVFMSVGLSKDEEKGKEEEKGMERRRPKKGKK